MKENIMLTILFYAGLIIIVLIAVNPIGRFLIYQWILRRQEFLNRFHDKTLSAYLERFSDDTQSTEQMDDLSKFLKIYKRVAGRHLYYVPAALLIATISILGGLVVATAIRSGYEQYVLFYKSWLGVEGNFGEQVRIVHQSIETIDAAVFPFSGIALSLQALAAISGAYLYVVGVVISGFRARTLLSSDLLWCSFRLVIAVPLGLSVGELASPTLGALIAFSLGAFPIEAINRLLRNVLSKSLNVSDMEKADQLVNLVGVTPDVSAALNSEGITAIQQLASMDPVGLAMRTALPFDYVIGLVAQSQAWCYIGSTMNSLAPLGFGDARSIAHLMQKLDTTPDDCELKKVLDSAAAAAKIDVNTLKYAFRRITEDPYTQFLLQFTR
jgi:hypothetical protein